jgi:hypothetical protein
MHALGAAGLRTFSVGKLKSYPYVVYYYFVLVLGEGLTWVRDKPS